MPPLQPANRIDELVFAKLDQLNIPPSKLCSDAVFLRRVYIDMTGTLSRAHEARRFLKSKDPQKRRRLIEELFKREAFADYWAFRWCDIFKVKSEFPSKLWPNAVQAYHRWIRTAHSGDATKQIELSMRVVGQASRQGACVDQKLTRSPEY